MIDVFPFTERLVTTFIQLNYIVLVAQYLTPGGGAVEQLTLYDVKIESEKYFSATVYLHHRKVYINRTTGVITTQKDIPDCEYFMKVTTALLLPHDVGFFKKHFTLLRYWIKDVQ